MANKRVKIHSVGSRNLMYNGIFLMGLPKYEQDIITNSEFLKFLNVGDIETKIQAIEIIFNICHFNKIKSRTEKIIWNPYKGMVTSLDELKKDTASIQWQCAICGKTIYSKIGSTKPENFLCKDCKNKKHELIDRRIVDSSIQFTEYCKYMLLKEQKKFLRYLHVNAKKKNKNWK